MTEIINEINTYYGRCVCCLSYGYLKTMWEEHYWEGEKEIYVEMLVQCFALSWVRFEDSLKRDHICESCVRRLRDANHFKKTVLESREQLCNTNEGEIKRNGLYLEQETRVKVEEVNVDEAKEDTGSEGNVDNSLYIDVPDDTRYEDQEDQDFLDKDDRKKIEYEDIEYLEDEDNKIIHTSDKTVTEIKVLKKNSKSERLYKRYTDEDLQACLEALKNRELTLRTASQKYNIPKSTITAKRRKQTISKSEVATKRCAAPKDSKSVKQLSQFELKKEHTEQLSACLETMYINKELKLKVVLEKYKNPENVVTDESHIDNKRECDEPPQKKRITKKRTAPSDVTCPKRVLKSERIMYRQYTEEDLQACLEALKNKKLTLKAASVIYNVPLSTITSLRRINAEGNIQRKGKGGLKKKRRGCEFQVKANVKNILANSNATPIKGYWGVGYACAYCSYQNPSPSVLKNHTIDNHSGELDAFNVTISFLDMMIKLDITGLQCKICLEKFAFLDKFMVHLQRCHDIEIYTDIKDQNIIPYKFHSDQLECAICSKPFEYFKYLTEHMTEHFRNFECDICGRGFIYAKALGVHRPRHQTGVFHCSYCDKVFNTRLKMKSHERVLHLGMSKTRKCIYCSEKFMDLVQRTKHEVSVHGIEAPSYECKACSKSFFSQLALKSHTQRFHLLLRPHVCNICGKGFYYKYHLKKHGVKHTGVREYKCDICHKWYTSRSSLIGHMKIHFDDRQFKCEVCDIRFVQKCSLLVHLRNKHGKIE